MDIETTVKQVLSNVLSLGARAQSLTATTPLLGALPEIDSMAIVNVIAALEDNFDIAIQDDEISGDTFATVGSLVDFIREKTGG